MIALSGRGRTRDQHSAPDENQIRCQQQLCSQLQCVISLDVGDLEIETKVHPKVRNHGEGPYQGLLLVESGYYRFHI